jgi:hypothetical protein
MGAQYWGENAQFAQLLYYFHNNCIILPAIGNFTYNEKTACIDNFLYFANTKP